MKTLGLIGGTSWYSTMVYYRLLNEMVGARLGTHLNPPLLLYSQNVELMRRGDWDEIMETYLNTALNLQRAGAQALLICANTPHKVVPFVEPQLDIPFIHIADATGEAANQQGLKTLGLLGTTPVMEEDFISGRLANNHQVRTLTPDQTARQKVQQIIADELTQGHFLPETKRWFVQEMDVLKSNGADGIILGCTELPILIEPADFDLPLLNTTYLHVQKAVAFIVQDDA